MAHLVLIDEKEQGKQYELSSDVTRIGRRGENNVPLNSGSVSGTHAEIIKTAEGFELRDLGSTNGTFLNGDRVQTARVHRNDVIRCGGVSLMFDGADVPMAPAGDAAEQAVLSRTTVSIRPLGPSEQKAAPPAAFQQEGKLRRLWPVLLGLILVAVIIAFVFYVLNMT